MFEEISDLLDKQDDKVSLTESNAQQNRKPKVDLWSKVWVGAEINKEALDPPAREFAIKLNPEVPEAVKETVKKICETLKNQGYKIRITGSHKEPIMRELEEIMEGHKEYYLPWRGFEEITDESKGFPGESFFETAAAYHKVYNDLKGPIKTLYANEVRLLIGNDMRSPVKFLLTWTTDAVDQAKRCSSKTGYASFMIKVADLAGIPVCNLAGDGLKKLESLLTS